MLDPSTTEISFLAYIASVFILYFGTSVCLVCCKTFFRSLLNKDEVIPAFATMRDNSMAWGILYSSGNGRKKGHGSVLSGELAGYSISNT